MKERLNPINVILKYNREKKEQKEIDILISLLYKRMCVLSNMNEKDFVKIINDFLKEYDNFKFIRDSNVLFTIDKQGKYHKMTREEKLKFIFPNRK